MLIGTARYDHHRLASIPGAAANVADLAEILTRPGAAFTTEQCATVVDSGRAVDVGDVVGRAAREAVEVLLVYYTGHGLLDRRGRLHLTVTSSDPDRIRWTTVPFEVLREEILDSGARARILILDCCFAGRAFEAMADLPSLVAGQTDIRGTYTIASCSANEPSFAPAGRRNTAFTAALLAAATTGGTLDELYRETDRCLHRDGHPRPHRRGIDIAGELRLFGRPRDPVLAVTEDLDEDAEIESLERAARAGDLNAMRSLGDLLGRRGRTADAEIWRGRAADVGNAMLAKAEGLVRQGNIAEAETWWRHAADAGNAAAMYSLGVGFSGKNPAEAEHWYRRAAEAGSNEAAYALGHLFKRKGDTADAITWYRRAAKAGNTSAMRNLGHLIKRQGDASAAESWYRQASEAGDMYAMRNLADLLQQQGNSAEAELWYRRATEIAR
ncbi:tetratricopeptide repeat protein [Nocardia sp. BMG111209]|uniref:tetratricopeptide repeat protein n=1 Tax=Nocardia sp. BMG111209 TaxID=1160137 RepID=UPI0012DC98BC|nr:tetratricopeptide repeat protein [Nocardia sp. BMG111209]